MPAAVAFISQYTIRKISLLFRIACFFLAIIKIHPTAQADEIKSVTRPIRFEHITIDDGLSQSIVTDIIQDRKGFIWFATEDGLNRYDGLNFKKFYHNPNDSASLSMNSISVLCEDHLGNIWVGTQDGLNLFDPGTERFLRFSADEVDSTSICSNLIQAIYQDSDSTIWIGTQNGLSCLLLSSYNKNIFEFHSYSYLPKDSLSLGANYIKDIYAFP